MTSNDKYVLAFHGRQKYVGNRKKNEIACHRNDNLSSMLNCNTIAIYLPGLDICFEKQNVLCLQKYQFLPAAQRHGQGMG